ncbi:uncharacterized protein [Ptychodera flava]|uniref:uncharacterized protein n=1 Tax=Ptychodera flava TaxID=63121 RepID=UPI00396A8B83
MARNGKDRDADRAVQTEQTAPRTPKKKDGATQGSMLEITEAPEERDNGQATQDTQRDEAPVMETSILKNNETRQLTMCLVAFAVGIVGIALLVLRNNLPMLVCGCIFLSLAGIAVFVAAIWRCYDARKYSSIGIEYAVARTSNTDDVERGPGEQAEADSSTV